MFWKIFKKSREILFTCSWAVLVLLKSDRDKKIQSRLQKWKSKRLIEELGSRERHERELSEIEMHGVSTGRDTGGVRKRREKRPRK